jgi:hypothetical protein
MAWGMIPTASKKMSSCRYAQWLFVRSSPIDPAPTMQADPTPSTTNDGSLSQTNKLLTYQLRPLGASSKHTGVHTGRLPCLLCLTQASHSKKSATPLFGVQVHGRRAAFRIRNQYLASKTSVSIHSRAVSNPPNADVRCRARDIRVVSNGRNINSTADIVAQRSDHT